MSGGRDWYCILCHWHVPYDDVDLSIRTGSVICCRCVASAYPEDWRGLRLSRKVIAQAERDAEAVKQ